MVIFAASRFAMTALSIVSVSHAVPDHRYWAMTRPPEDMVDIFHQMSSTRPA